MIINQFTKISELIKANELCIDAIASIAKPLRKIKIPILRKVLTPRVNIMEAAKIANCSVDDFRRVLEPLGFTWEEQTAALDATEEKENTKPGWLLESEHIVPLDVRPILDAGRDPLKEIMSAYKSLPEKAVLEIINTFLPFPLISRLEDKGAFSYTDEVSKTEFHTYFYKPMAEKSVTKIESMISFVSYDVIEGILNKKSFDMLELDVRSLPMPQPMERILETLAQLKANEGLFVQHKKVPLYLLEELGNLPYRVFVSEIAEGDVRILIHP
ncbi:DUF2249 domain-containing protein [Sphingobacterium sp.]|uniref:DUF2249 domain-containing protein n=1 Tax=Sphingobacterium sp. TaxID=341027 RepID=UPI0028A6950A|nr:DUF2249 domain-containing protein [Sphingobacterium sp.]